MARLQRVKQDRVSSFLSQEKKGCITITLKNKKNNRELPCWKSQKRPDTISEHLLPFSIYGIIEW